MLCESAIAFDYSFDPATVADPAVPTGIPGGDALRRFVDALFCLPDTSLDAARIDVLGELGPEAFVDACSVYGNFQMMNRVAEGTGIPVPSQAIEQQMKLIRALGLTVP